MTSSEEEDEDEYEVERILAEEVIDSARKFLVKWKGYPDEECTWEPAENFHAPETLQSWNQQKANDDILDGKDLKRIQDQMDAFQAKQVINDGESVYSSEGQSDIDLDALQPPTKRLKMVHEPPPLRGKRRTPKKSMDANKRPPSTAGLIKPIDASNSKANRPNTLHFIPKDKHMDQIAKSDHTPPHVSASSISSISHTAKRTASNSELPSSGKAVLTSAQHKPPRSFHAPELVERKRRLTNEKRSRKVISGKPFRNLRHLNNARKLQQVDRPPKVLVHTEANELKQNSDVSASARAPEAQVNDSWLFFSEDSESDTETSSTDQDDRRSRRGRQSFGVDRLEIDECEPRNESQSEAMACTEQAQASKSVALSHIDDRPQTFLQLGMSVKRKADIEDAGTEVDSNIISDSSHQVPDGISTAMSTTVLPDIFPENQSTEARPGPTTEKTDASNISTSAANITMEGHPTVTTSTTFVAHGARSIAPSNIKEGRDQGSTVSEPFGTTQPAYKGVSQGAIVKVPTGRTWVKGDLVLELYLQGTACGGIKAQNLPWPQRSEIIRLKGKNSHSLPLYFDRTITRKEYDSLSDLSWWTSLAVGSVEAFPDSEENLASLAGYLEKNDIAAFWEHPVTSLDRMILLYSCRSLSWQNIAPPQRTRIGEPRLHIMIRTRFKARQGIFVTRPGGDTSTNFADERSDLGNAGTIETRNDQLRKPRSWTTSVSTDVGPSLQNDSMTSPSSQLVQEMAKYGLGNRSPRATFASARRRSSAISETNLSSTEDHPRRWTPCTGGVTTTSSFELHGTSAGTSSCDKTTICNISSEGGPQDEHDRVTSEQWTPTWNANTRMHPSLVLDRDIEQISGTSSPSSFAVECENIYAMIFYRLKELNQAQAIRDSLLKQQLLANQVLLQPMETYLAEKEHETWKKFKSHLKAGPCVLMCDKSCPLNRLEGLGKMIEHDNFICWQLSPDPINTRQIKTTRLFPVGFAVAIAQDCYLNEPENVMYILKWLKKRTEKPRAASKLLFPPRIFTTIQEQAVLSTYKENKKKFLRLMAYMEELISISSTTNADDPYDMGFTVMLPDWDEVYTNVPFTTYQIPAIDQKKHDRVLSDSFLGYFGTWALQNCSQHRRFLGFITDTKPQETEHIRFLHCKTFVEQERQREKRKENARSRSRDPSINQEQRRSQSRGRGVRT